MQAPKKNYVYWLWQLDEPQAGRQFSRTMQRLPSHKRSLKPTAKPDFAGGWDAVARMNYRAVSSFARAHVLLGIPANCEVKGEKAYLVGRLVLQVMSQDQNVFALLVLAPL